MSVDSETARSRLDRREPARTRLQLISLVSPPTLSGYPASILAGPATWNEPGYRTRARRMGWKLIAKIGRRCHPCARLDRYVERTHLPVFGQLRFKSRRTPTGVQWEITEVINVEMEDLSTLFNDRESLRYVLRRWHSIITHLGVNEDVIF